jgi:tRNA(His) guanylyltransferase
MVLKMEKDQFGNRMKEYEFVETGRRFMPLLPVYARIDGRSFSKFTHGLERPYDMRMSCAMINTTQLLVEETNALIGFTQSDEISLAWYSDNYDSQIFFDGKVQKMCSVLAGLATSAFMRECFMDETILGEKARKLLPHFDCRVFQLPNKMELANAFLWRAQDAAKNSISMAARAYYSHKELDGKSGPEKHDMLHAKGINWNDYPAFFKEGTWIQRRKVVRNLTQAELERIPEAHRPTGPVERTEYAELEMPPFGRVTNRIEVIFDGAEPKTV